MTTMTREEQKQVLIDTANHIINRNNTSPYSENLRELARIALASLEAEPVGAFHIAEQQVDGTSDYLKDGEWPIDNGIIDVYAAPPATVSVPDEIYAELYQLREEVKGPDGFNTWRDAATAEKVLRLSIERDALRYRFLRDKDAFGDENEPGLASWGDLAEMEYNEFDANVDARMNNSDIPRYSITQSQMIENDVAASEKKAPNERYKQISDIDYLGAMSAFHSDKWHKMGSITGYMHGWNACRAAMLHGKSEQPQNAQQNIPENIPGGNSPVIPDGWISCSERMPEDGQHVIILCDGAFVLYAQYRDGEFFDIVRNGDEFFETQSRNVTDWMPIPEPPQQDGE